MSRPLTNFGDATLRRIVPLLMAATLLMAVGQATLAPTEARSAALPASETALPDDLDRTGRTLPKTNYPIPSGAVFMSPAGLDTNPGTLGSPVKTLNRAVALAPAGGTIVLRSGEYRDWYTDKTGNAYGIVAKGLTFQAYPGESPWLNGSDLVDPGSFTKVSGKKLWRLNWSTPAFCDGQYYGPVLAAAANTGPCAHYDMSRDPSHPKAFDPQMVFVDGRELHQVTSVAKVRATSFHYDIAKRVLTVGTAPSGRSIEVSKRPVALVLGNRQPYKVLGIGFRKYATNEFPNLTNGALRIGGAVSLVENSVFTLNSAAGLTYSNPQPGSVVRRTVFASNGYIGMGANGASISRARNDFVVSGNAFFRNNTQYFGTGCTISCGQAAAKFAHMVGITLSHNRVEETRGAAGGLWCDLDCVDAKIVHNVVERNAGGPGIFYEVSDAGIIAGNVSSRNLYGITVASANTKVYNNTLVDNRQGIRIYDDHRTRGRDGWHDVGPDTRNVEVVNNVIAGGGYSLMAYSMRVGSPAPNTGAEDLFSRVDHNAIYQSNGTSPTYVYWRTRAGKLSLFRTAGTFSSKVDLGENERWLKGRTNPLLVNPSGGDVRVTQQGSAYPAAALPSDVAQALGVSPSAVRKRGALVPG